VLNRGRPPWGFYKIRKTLPAIALNAAIILMRSLDVWASLTGVVPAYDGLPIGHGLRSGSGPFSAS
jgi:hypothetical protein